MTVRLIDISSAGCLLETSGRLEKGATGLLRVFCEDGEYMDDIRIVRCQEPKARAACSISAPNSSGRTSPHERSLRRIVGKLQGTDIRTGSVTRLM